MTAKSIYQTYSVTQIKRRSVKIKGTRLEFTVNAQSAKVGTATITDKGLKFIAGKKRSARPAQLLVFRNSASDDPPGGQLKDWHRYAESLAKKRCKCIMTGMAEIRPVKIGAKTIRKFHLHCITR